MKITFDTENKAKNDYDYPRLYLEYGERARIVCIENEPEMEFVHNLRAPAIINGEVAMETVKTKDGVVEKPKMDFVGKHLCFGLPNNLMKNGKDPENCPTCAAANQYDYIGEATRRFSMHVVQYRIQPNGHKVQTPFQAELVAWTFSNKVFNTITDIAEEHGDLRAKDLLLGPCENKMFQKFDIQVGGSAEWLKTPENKALVTTIYKENKSDDLTPLIGRKVSREMAQEDIDKVMLKHAQAFGGSMPDAPDVSEAGAGISLDAMLAGPSEPVTKTEEEPKDPWVATIDANPETFSPEPSGFEVDSAPSPAATPDQTTPEPEVPAVTEQPSVPDQTTPATSGAELDFDKLLEGL